MTFSVRQLHPLFFGEISGVDLATFVRDLRRVTTQDREIMPAEAAE